MSDSPCNDPSRDRLLLAAVEIFAERGFRDATVREICAKAEVNAASVNYYFGGKEKLYAEALAFALCQANQRYPLGDALNLGLPAEQRLIAFIQVFLHKLLDNTALGHHGKLIAREIADPTSALDGIINTAIAPQFAMLKEVIPSLVGPGWSESDIYRCILSIVGQCLMYKHSRSVVDRICPNVIASPDEINSTADHIAKFSLAALNHLRREGTQA
ncbi:MAG: CerR family C-terminal domain-containing protein [Candidatus Methylumidiphilus sp.]